MEAVTKCRRNGEEAISRKPPVQAGIALMFLLTILALSFPPLFIHFRDFHSIKLRNTFITHALFLTIALRGLVVITTFFVPSTCTVIVFIDYFVVGVLILVFCLRNVMLLWMFKQQRDKIRVHDAWIEHEKKKACCEESSSSHVHDSSLKETPVLSSFYIRYDITKRRNFTIIVSVGLLICLLIGLVMVNGEIDPLTCEPLGTGQMLFFFWTISGILVIVICFLNMHKESDNTFLKHEQACVCMWLAITVPMDIWTGRSAPEYNLLSSAFLNHGILLLTGLVPLVRVYLTWRRQHELDPYETVRDQLSSPEGHLAFTEYLRKEFAVENIFFYDEIVNFEVNFAQWSQKKRIAATSRIFKKYIERGSAPLEINIPYQIYADIYKNIGVPLICTNHNGKLMNVPTPTSGEKCSTCKMDNEKMVLTVDLFSSAKDHIYELMNNSSFTNFKLKMKKTPRKKCKTEVMTEV